MSIKSTGWIDSVTIKIWKNFWAVLCRMFHHKNVVRSSTSNCNKMLISNSLIKSFQPEHICNTSETANWRGKSKSGNKKSDTETMDNAMRGHQYYLPFSHNQVPWLQIHYMTLQYCSYVIGAKRCFGGPKQLQSQHINFLKRNVLKILP